MHRFNRFTTSVENITLFITLPFSYCIYLYKTHFSLFSANKNIRNAVEIV